MLQPRSHRLFARRRVGRVRRSLGCSSTIHPNSKEVRPKTRSVRNFGCSPITIFAHRNTSVRSNEVEIAISEIPGFQPSAKAHLRRVSSSTSVIKSSASPAGSDANFIIVVCPGSIRLPNLPYSAENACEAGSSTINGQFAALRFNHFCLSRRPMIHWSLTRTTRQFHYPYSYSAQTTREYDLPC